MKKSALLLFCVRGDCSVLQGWFPQSPKVTGSQGIMRLSTTHPVLVLGLWPRHDTRPLARKKERPSIRSRCQYHSRDCPTEDALHMWLARNSFASRITEELPTWVIFPELHTHNTPSASRVKWRLSRKEVKVFHNHKLQGAIAEHQRGLGNKRWSFQTLPGSLHLTLWTSLFAKIRQHWQH